MYETPMYITFVEMASDYAEYLEADFVLPGAEITEAEKEYIRFTNDLADACGLGPQDPREFA